MKNFLFNNDKTTVWDEVLLLFFILVCVGVGTGIYLFAPTDWVISVRIIKCFGVILDFIGVMFIPGLIYRLMTNDKRRK